MSHFRSKKRLAQDADQTTSFLTSTVVKKVKVTSYVTTPEMVGRMCRRHDDVVTCQRRRRHHTTINFQIFIFIIVVVAGGINQFSLAEDVGSQQQHLGCAWRPKNSSLFCLVVGSSNRNKSHSLAGVTRHHRDVAKNVEIECAASKDKDLRRVDLKNDDYLDDVEGASQVSSSASREHWSQIQLIKVKGCPLHQVAVIDDNRKETTTFKKPFLRATGDSKAEDFFTDFFQQTVGGRIDWTRIRTLDLTFSGLNRPLTTRTRTFCELSESVTSLDVSFNYYSSVLDVFGSALKVSDKCPFAKLSDFKFAANQLTSITSNDFLFSPNVENLDLSSNRIDRIEIGALRHLTNLKTLDLSDNRLTSLTTPAPWSNLSSIRELYLQGNSLDRLPDFAGLPNLVALNLSRNGVADLNDNSFGNLGELVALDLSHNRIVLVNDDAFFGLKSLQVLTLTNNRIQTIAADSLSHLATLHVLLLSHNVIEHVHQVRN